MRIILKKSDKPLIAWGRFPLLTLGFAAFFALFFFQNGRIELGTSFTVYGAILFFARVRIWRLLYGFPGALLTRSMIRAAVFFLPLPFLALPPLGLISWGIPLSIGGVMILLLLQFPHIRLALSKDFVALLPPLSKEEKIQEIFHPVLSAISQEYLYRGVLLYELQRFLNLWAVFLVALLFTLEHVMHENSAQAFDTIALTMHFLLSILLGFSFYFFPSLIGCVVGHLLYNFPSMLQAIRTQSE